MRPWTRGSDMSEATVSTGAGHGPAGGRRGVGGRRLSAVLPGVGQVLSGRWGSGGTAALVWLGFLWILVTRWDRVRGAVAGPWDARLAVMTLLAGLVAAWVWSWWDAGRVDEPKRAGVSHWHLAVRTFSRHGTAVAGSMVIVALYLAALLAPLLTPFDPTFQGDLLTERLVGPSGVHPLGTDQYARDVLARLLYGARISLTIGFVAAGIAVTIGTLLGAVAGGAQLVAAAAQPDPGADHP